MSTTCRMNHYRGEQGIAGENGLPGVKGDAGPRASNGRDGRDGAQGPKGEQGPPGEQGIAGERGLPGVKGDAGGWGRNGRDGHNGKIFGQIDTTCSSHVRLGRKCCPEFMFEHGNLKAEFRNCVACDDDGCASFVNVYNTFGPH